MFRTLTPIFAVILAIAIYFFFTQPMFAEIKEVQNEIDGFQQALDSAGEYNNTLQSLIAKKESLTAREAERLEALVPEIVNEIQLIVDLEALAETHELLIGNFGVDSSNNAVVERSASDVREVSSLDELSHVDISFGLIGSYDQFRAMLIDIERSLYRFEVISIEFSSGTSELQQYNLTVRSYALPSS